MKNTQRKLSNQSWVTIKYNFKLNVKVQILPVMCEAKNRIYLAIIKRNICQGTEAALEKLDKCLWKFRSINAAVA